MPAFSNLTTSATRAAVATAIDDVIGVDMGAALLLADLLDGQAAAACRVAGLSDAEALDVLGRLFGGPQRPAADPQEDGADLATAVDDLGALAHRALLRDLARTAPAVLRGALTRQALDGGGW